MNQANIAFSITHQDWSYARLVSKKITIKYYQQKEYLRGAVTNVLDYDNVVGEFEL